MTRAHALFACLILIAAPLAGCLSGDDLEELVDDIIGCMDENAANYEENATSELVGDCIYMATMDTFMDAMSDVRTIEEMLEDTPKAGYSQSMNVNEWNDELGMQMDVMIIETVMADLDNDAVHVHNFISIAPLMTMSYTHAQIGEVVNIHYTAGGMIAEGGESESYQTRDATPNVLEVLADQVGLFSGEEGGEGMLVETPDSDVDEIPEDAVITITMSDDMESQTMTMEYTEDGAEITMTIHINQNEDLMSFNMASDNGSATTNIEYQMMWGDAVVIEVDETLPKTSIPVWVDIESWGDDDTDEDDTFYCDNGNEIPMDYVDDGWDDCGDGSDEPEPEMVCWNSYGDYITDADQDTCYSWMYLEDYDSPHSDEPFTGCYNSHTHVQLEGMSEEECTTFMWVDSEMFDDDDHDDHGDDDHHDDGNHISWDSYYDGYCEWEGDPDGDDTRWWCKESQDDEYWSEWWYYCEHHDSDWHCTDDFGQSEEFEYSADGDEWSGSEDGEDGHDDDDGPPSPEDAMYMADSDGDGNMSQEEFVTYWNNENPDAPIDSDQSFLTTEDVVDLIMLCDYDDPSDLIDINEMQCFIDNLVGMMPNDENTPSLDDFFNHFDTDGDGHLTATEFIDAHDGEIPDEDQDGVHDMFDMYDNDESGGLDYYEFEPLYDMMVDSDDGDDGDDDGHGMERNDATGFVAENQTLNAPITDFEVHFLSDCEEEYDEEEDQMIQPDLSTCTNEFSIPLNGGEAEGVTITYTDHDGDGLVSPGDEMSVEWGDYDGEEIDKMEIYDTYASQYSSESAAMPPVLPGFGAILGALALLGAAIASRRD